MSFKVHERASVITHISVNLENGGVYFTKNNLNFVNNPREMTLTVFFELCRMIKSQVKPSY